MPGPTLLTQVAARDSFVGASATRNASTSNALETLPTTCLTAGCDQRYVTVAKRCRREPLPPAMTDEPRFERSLVQSSQASCHRRSQKRRVRDREQVLRDEPHLFVGCHPIEIVESREIHRPRERAERSLAPEIEVSVEITHGQLAQRAMDRLTVCEAVVVRLRHRAPVAALLEDRDDVIGVMLGFEVNDERGETQYAERRRPEDRGLETVRRPLAQDAPWRPRRRRQVIGHVVEKSLHAVRRLERAQRS